MNEATLALLIVMGAMALGLGIGAGIFYIWFAPLYRPR